MRQVALFMLAMFASAALPAATLEVAVVDDKGAAVADAVISVLPHAGLDTGRGAPRTKTIDQRALRFDPYIELFRPGDRVVFRNSDRTSHHVYSFSPNLPFETMVAPGASSAPMTLDTPGVIAVGCNIHDRMVTYLVVGDAPFVARSDDTGVVRFGDLPAGTYAVRVWQPRLRKAQKGPVEKTADLTARVPLVSVRFEVALLPDARRQTDRETLKY